MGAAASGSPAAGAIHSPQPKWKEETDPCLHVPAVSNPTRPNWDGGASTTQCGILEVDFGWMRQPMGGGVHQWSLMSSVRFGITPKLDLRWALESHVSQGGGASAPQSGVGDQWANLTYRFHEQSPRMPAMAFSYGAEIPTASPSIFGNGITDHQFVLIASRDIRKIHLDFDTVGELSRDAGQQGGAIDFGMMMTRQLNKKLAWTVESYGGSQTGTTDRLGAVQSGLSFAVRPWLVMDAAYVKPFTDGSPQQQLMFGITYATRPFFKPPPKRLALARLVGR
jgi:hypothetical protein